MTTWWCSDGEEDAALPVPKRRRFGDFPPPGFLSAGPSSAFSSELPSRCTSPRPATEDALGLLLLPPSFLPGHRCHRRLLVRRLTGGLLPSARLEDGSGGPFSGLGGASAPGWTGDRSPSSPPDSFLSPERSLEAPGGPAWTLPSGERAGTTSVNRGPSPPPGPRPRVFLPPLVAFHGVMAVFPPGVPFFSAKDLPGRGETGEGRSFFRRETFRSGNTPPCLTSSVAFLQSAGGGALLPRRGSLFSLPGLPVGCLSGFVDRL
ncbi:hypothetical protein GWK47_040373 [Chionoecetes opilio]|uniref:Uncharacterized protein n=1 Tax=Chionoecetes opilio TaxID=41210 RepID=A0A8J5D0Y1_CHIOP|nr:hypothetical protein GWK47_040373 [Chionoecetes opilio]